MFTTRSLGATIALGTIASGCGFSRSNDNFIPGPAADYRSAALAEVRNAQDQVILSGRFVETAGDGENEIERTATLTATGADPDASGAVEVETCRPAGCDSQEVEFEVTNVDPGAVIRFAIDGKLFATVTVDRRGRATVERSVPFPR